MSRRAPRRPPRLSTRTRFSNPGPDRSSRRRSTASSLANFRRLSTRRSTQARAEIDAVAADPEPPTFANTIEALERSGRSLDRVASVFFNLVGAHTNDELQAIEREIAPNLARHRSETYLNEALFKRIDAIKADAGKLGLSAEQARVLDRYHLDFTRAGAGAAARSQGATGRDRRAAGDARGGIRSARARG